MGIKDERVSVRAKGWFQVDDRGDDYVNNFCEDATHHGN
jgi:hypothetical protein